ncbi:MAG TPA: hypothetical protein VFK88_06200 [Gallionella sp.]|nr:hypothetical protein [Gallionella sp.]
MTHYSEDQLDYIDQVFDRARKLIQARIWDEVKMHRLESWRGCFENFGAELVGAYLLDNLCFRSRDQFFSLLDTLFLDHANIGCDQWNGHFVDVVQSRPTPATESSVRIVPVIGLQAPPTKSGPYILRLAQRRYSIKSQWLSWPQHVGSIGGLSELIFLDDFCGTGQQFVEFAESIELTQLHKANGSMKVSYLVAAAHEEGVNNIRKELPFVHVRCAERLGPANSVLHDTCFQRYQIDGFQNLVLDQYADVTKRAGLPQGKLAEGFGNLALAYGFAHATPNNTLPIFWYETDSWTPLLDR